MQRARGRSPLILALFCLSGFAALVYETVWTRQLTLVFGATITSASTVLAGFMAGLGLGAPEVFWRLRLGPGESFSRYLGDSPEITDDFPRLEYPYFRFLRAGYYLNPRIVPTSN